MTIQRGEIYFVNLAPVQGGEPRGSRPVAVVSSDAINRHPLVVTVVVGTKGANVERDYPVNLRVPAAEAGLPEETVFLGFQIHSLDHARFPAGPAGRLPPQRMNQLESIVRRCLEL